MAVVTQATNTCFWRILTGTCSEHLHLDSDTCWSKLEEAEYSCHEREDAAEDGESVRPVQVIELETVDDEADHHEDHWNMKPITMKITET